ncbi:hypothetical protein LTR47_011546 [Exophiala xenobiotica]|nr:hypothetical protein LTR47_011546 [Exophiala xenobiotica]KAK5281819.1 hypothetical protein LTR40_004238 [Exophiala xenobiotica]KAK5284672.1 hypothetical protein LTR14_011579 [Exophiala xenobiotica]KAK5357184.1 hypothetical protein LTR11_011562 [Exophiala xenobiotica]KAK5357501.1 hypothetical protein LTS03_011560 [Exophiala xenobiotica]
MSSSHPSRKTVDFRPEPSVKYIEKSYRPTMAKQLFETFDGHEVTDSMLTEAAGLFNGNYGIWGTDPTNPRSIPKQGSRVKLSKDRLRAQYLPENVDCSYAKVTIEDHLAGNAFACRWRVKDKIVCWITQLVVHGDYRERGLAVGLLNCLRRDDDNIYGLMSSHPAACLAAAKAFGSGINSVATGFIRDNANSLMKESPIEYVRNAELRGNLFNPDDTSGVISSVCTNFFVDHTEPLEALDWVRQGLSWPLGELLDGHEFLLIIETRLRSRSRSRSASHPGA